MKSMVFKEKSIFKEKLANPKVNARGSQARSQKFAMGRGCFGGLGANPLADGGTGVWVRNPQRSKILHFLQKQLNFRTILIKKNNAFKTRHRNWQCKHD